MANGQRLGGKWMENGKKGKFLLYFSYVSHYVVVILSLISHFVTDFCVPFSL
jgi:hypothetical protein